MTRARFCPPRAIRSLVRAAILAGVMACCPSPAVADDGATRPAVGVAAPAGSSELSDMAWLPDGSGLLVGRRWLLSLRDQRFTALQCALGSNAPRDDCAAKDIAFAPDGARMLVLDRASFAIGSRKGPLGAPIRIPRWVKSGDSGPAKSDSDLVNLAFWLSARVIFVQQFDPATPFEPECRLFDPRGRVWRRPRGGCLAGDFGHLFRVQSGPGGWLLLSSSSEGHHALGLVRYDPAAGQSDPGIPPLLLAAPGPINVRFAGDGSRVDLISPCDLEGQRPPPCGSGEAGSPWKLYSWPTTGGAISLRRSDLHPGSVLDPTGAHFAWPENNGICIGDPHRAESRCIPLPSS